MVSLYPRRGTLNGGTTIQIQAQNIPTADLLSSFYCQFSLDFDAGGATYTQTATRLNDTFVSCTTPDLSASFPSTEEYLDIYVALTDQDGTYSIKEKLVFTYLKEETVTSISPTNAFLDQQPYITITGTNFYNLVTLCVKLDFVSTYQEDIYINNDVLWISSTSLVFRMPHGHTIDLRGSHDVHVYVSNNCQEFTSAYGTFTFDMIPHMTSIS